MTIKGIMKRVGNDVIIGISVITLWTALVCIVVFQICVKINSTDFIRGYQHGYIVGEYECQHNPNLCK